MVHGHDDEACVTQGNGRVEVAQERAATSGNALPFSGALNATVIVVGPIDTGLTVAWLGYQMPMTKGLPFGSAANPC